MDSGEWSNYIKGLVIKNKVLSSQLLVDHNLLIAKCDSIIQKDDILIDLNNRTFKVERLQEITHYGIEENNCYRIEGRLKLIEED